MEERPQVIVIEKPVEVPLPPKAVADSKTMWFNLATVAAGVLEVTQWITDTHVLPPGPAMIAVGAINMILRYYTKQPVELLQKPKLLGETPAH